MGSAEPSHFTHICDAHILQWTKNVGDIEDHRLRAEFYHIQRELAQIIMKEVVEKTGMFYEEGQMSREDVRTRVAAHVST